MKIFYYLILNSKEETNCKVATAFLLTYLYWYVIRKAIWIGKKEKFISILKEDYLLLNIAKWL